MRQIPWVAVVCLAVASCSSSPDSATPATSVIATNAAVLPAAAPTSAESSTTTATTTTIAIIPAAPGEPARLPEPLDACNRLESAIASFSPVVLTQDADFAGLVPAEGDIGYGCSGTWQEEPPNSTLLRTNLLFYSKEKMTSEMDRIGYNCDPTPEVVPGWSDAFTCHRSTDDGPGVVIWLDTGGQSVSLSIRGDFANGFTPQDVVNVLTIVLGPGGTVAVAPTIPAVSPTIAPTPTIGVTASVPLPSSTWDGKYIAEPVSGALRIGDRGSRVTELQRNLGVADLLDPPFDGYFGPDTEAAVVAFQRQEGLVVNGIAGPEVLQAFEPG